MLISGKAWAEEEEGDESTEDMILSVMYTLHPKSSTGMGGGDFPSLSLQQTFLVFPSSAWAGNQDLETEPDLAGRNFTQVGNIVVELSARQWRQSMSPMKTCLLCNCVFDAEV